MPFKKLAEKGNWYKVQDVDGDIHWIYSKLVTDEFDCAVVKVDEANVRSGPGIKYKKTTLSPVIKYESFKVIKRKGLWVKVEDEFGNTGWIYRKLLWIY
jgi:SH3-like domain-containing protein